MSETPRVSQSSTPAVTELLARWRTGDEKAVETLLPIVYGQLRKLAHGFLRRERSDHTLQSTALVHEAYLRLVKQERTDFQNRAHFFAISAQLMRRILVDYARKRRADRRDGGFRVVLDDAIAVAPLRGTDVIRLDEALKGLAALDPGQSRIVELRFFAGLSIAETADVLSLSPATVKRRWATARAWLLREMDRSSDR
jgi:RNA polymerase sigma factor (TIGR02999 family)